MVMTKRGVYHNLNKSKYATSNSEVVFFFSSTFYLGKYLKEYKDHRKIFRKRISRAMIVTEMNTDLLADIHLYRIIEKRGFRTFLLCNVHEIVGFNNQNIRGGDVSWQKLHQFALLKMTELNTQDWSEMQGQKLEELLKITG